MNPVCYRVICTFDLKHHRQFRSTKNVGLAGSTVGQYYRELSSFELYAMCNLTGPVPDRTFLYSGK